MNSGGLGCCVDKEIMSVFTISAAWCHPISAGEGCWRSVRRLFLLNAIAAVDSSFLRIFTAGNVLQLGAYRLLCVDKRRYLAQVQIRTLIGGDSVGFVLQTLEFEA